MVKVSLIYQVFHGMIGTCMCSGYHALLHIRDGLGMRLTHTSAHMHRSSRTPAQIQAKYNEVLYNNNKHSLFITICYQGLGVGSTLFDKDKILTGAYCYIRDYTSI